MGSEGIMFDRECGRERERGREWERVSEIEKVGERGMCPIVCGLSQTLKPAIQIIDRGNSFLV